MISKDGNQLIGQRWAATKVYRQRKMKLPTYEARTSGNLKLDLPDMNEAICLGQLLLDAMGQHQRIGQALVNGAKVDSRVVSGSEDIFYLSNLRVLEGLVKMIEERERIE